MKRQTCVVGILLVLIVSVGVIYLLGPDGIFGDYFTETFDDEGRYDSTNLNNMGVIYSNQSDIAHWNNGYSESDVCPWGAEHNGLDYMYLKLTK